MASQSRAIDPRFNDIVLLVGRILIAALFMIAAYAKFKSLGQTTGYFDQLGIPVPRYHGAVRRGVRARRRRARRWSAVQDATRVARDRAILVVSAALIAHTNFADGNQLNHFLKSSASRRVSRAVGQRGRARFGGCQEALVTRGDLPRRR